MALVEEVGTLPAINARELKAETRRIEPGVIVLAVNGSMILERRCEQLESLVRDLLTRKENKIVFDVSEVTRIDSTGVGIIAICAGLTRNAGGELRVAGAHGRVQHVLNLAKVNCIVSLYPTITAALEGLIRQESAGSAA